jgi:hypothetical protein
MMKRISMLLIPILFPSALSAMNGASSSQKPKPIEASITPIFCHARADQGHATMDFGYCEYHGNRASAGDEMIFNGNAIAVVNDCPDDEKTILATHSSNPVTWFKALQKISHAHRRRIGYAVGGKKLIIQETIPNDEIKQFTVLFALKNYPSDSWHQGAVIEKYGQKHIPLGDASNGVQYLLNIPASDPYPNGSIKKVDRSENADLSDDAKKLLAIIDECNERFISKAVIARFNLGLLIFVLGVLATGSQSSSN